jgi:hypothetical protein
MREQYLLIVPCGAKMQPIGVFDTVEDAEQFARKLNLFRYQIVPNIYFDLDG